MTVTRKNVEFAKRIFSDRLGDPYVYGGNWDPMNVKTGTDCSGLVGDCLDAVNMGTAMPWRRSVTTESWGYDYRNNRPVPPGTAGPKGTIAVASLDDVPADAAVIVNIHHGGGGASSHTQCIVDGIVMESNGSHGTCTRPGGGMDPRSTYWTDHWYLPGPILADGTPTAPIGVGSAGSEVIALQQRLNTEGAGLEVDGDYGPKTAAAVVAWDLRTGYARTVLAEGVRRGISPRGIQITFTVPFVESGWKMYANSKVPESMSIPHDAVGNDYDSVGLLQQRCPMWGPASVLMNPAQSAGLFYDRLAKVNYNDTSRLPGDFAADIQRPAAQYRGRYQEHWDHAVALYNRLTTTAPTTPTTPGDDMAQVPQDQWDRVYRELTQKLPSRSPLRHLGEGPIDTMAGFVLNTDGSEHVEICRLLAGYGHPPTLALLREVAGADPVQYPDRQDDAELAQAILAEATTTIVAPSKAPQVAAVAPTPQIVYVDRPAPVVPAAEPTVINNVTAAPSSTGQVIGQAYDALEALQLSGALTDSEKAPLLALIGVLNTKTGASA